MSEDQYPKAMHGPEGAYKEVASAQEEAELREEGWIDGHEHFSAMSEQTEEVRAEETEIEKPSKPKKSSKKKQATDGAE